jgi:predicted TIM-barrel fold metal-dependent hydrolase
VYNGVKVFDVHGHVSAPAAARQLLAGMLASNTALRSPFQPGGRPLPGLDDDAFRAAGNVHLDLMDGRQIDVQIIGPRPFMMLGWMQPHLLAGWTSFVNDTIAKQTSLFPDRFLGAAQLPQNSNAPDLSHCLAELERCHQELGFVAAYLSPDPGGQRTTPGMHERYWDPVYAYCERNGLPAIVHGTNSLDPRISIIPQNYQIGFVWEQFLATQLLSHGDVFERFPGLKVIVCHCGGALDRFIKTDHHLSQKDLSNNLFFDTNALDLDFLEAAIKQRGVSQTCFGTEVPGSGAAVRPETGRPGDDLVPVIAGFDFLTEADKVAIFNRNPLRLFPAFDRPVESSERVLEYRSRR